MLASGASSLATRSKYDGHRLCSAADFPIVWIVLKVKTTSFEVKGLPSCHFTPLRRLNVMLRPSLDWVHDSARTGTGSSELDSPTSPSKMRELARVKRVSSSGLR